MRIRFTSPRSTQLYQMLASGPISTSPISCAPGATKAVGSTRGVLLAKVSISRVPFLERDRVDDHRVHALGPVGVDIVEILASRHSKPLHQAPALVIACDGERNHARRLESSKRLVQRGDRRLLGIALPPRILAKAPADLD